VLDAKIVGGLVVDGTGAEPYRADIGVKDGVIVEVNRGRIETKPPRRSTPPGASSSRAS